MYKDYYRINNQNGNIIIDIKFERYSDFYHSLDNALTNKRDLNPELKEYLELCSLDIPLKKKIELDFSIDEKVDETSEDEIRTSFRKYYDFNFHYEKLKIRNGILNAVLLACISGGLMIAGIVFSDRAMNLPELVRNVITEGLSIGSWVFMWEAVHILSFKTFKNVKRKREYNRYAKADLRFI